MVVGSVRNHFFQRRHYVLSKSHAMQLKDCLLVRLAKEFFDSNFICPTWLITKNCIFFINVKPYVPACLRCIFISMCSHHRFCMCVLCFTFWICWSCVQSVLRTTCLYTICMLCILCCVGLGYSLWLYFDMNFIAEGNFLRTPMQVATAELVSHQHLKCHVIQLRILTLNMDFVVHVPCMRCM